MNGNKLFIFSFLATILIIASIPFSIYLTNPDKTPDVPTETPETEIELNTFSSYDELRSFLATKTQGNYFAVDSRGDELKSGDVWARPESPEAAPAVSETENTDYSETNIQVEGVDEADIVKTDGEYIYVVSANNLTIIKAYPPEEAEVVSRMSLDGTIMGIYINGDKMALFMNEYSVYLLVDGITPTDISTVTKTEPAVVDDVVIDEEPNASESENNNTPEESQVPEPMEDPARPIEPYVWEPPTTTIKVYDVSDKENPVLTRDFSIDGDYFNSRMIGDYVYIVATMYTFFTETDVALPRLRIDNETEIIAANDIYYYNSSDTSYTFTTIVAVNINDDAQEPTHKTIMLGGTSAIYVSLENIYLTFPDYNWQEDDDMKTTIYRARINEESISFVATGQIPGYILNQFSMDEYNDYFRIATTTNNFNWRTFAENEPSTNNVYVLDMNLRIVGTLENLAPGEQIYSARFMGDRLYLVTFRNIDPLFVIDLSNPTAPAILGQLKITGYSGYIHIYDDDHIIGIGKETEFDAKEDFSWYQGLKISLFDVSNVSNPTEVAKYEIGDRGTDSPILYDHKSLLFDREKNLLVLPVMVAEINESQYDGEVPDYAYGEPVWQGVYIFDVSPNGIELRGRITHIEDDEPLNSIFYYYSYYGYTIQRSLHIENVLYTISSMKVKMNNLETLGEIKTIEIA